jgi:hypothetical protein
MILTYKKIQRKYSFLKAQILYISNKKNPKLTNFYDKFKGYRRILFLF